METLKIIIGVMILTVGLGSNMLLITLCGLILILSGISRLVWGLTHFLEMRKADQEL